MDPPSASCSNIYDKATRRVVKALKLKGAAHRHLKTSRNKYGTREKGNPVSSSSGGVGTGSVGGTLPDDDVEDSLNMILMTEQASSQQEGGSSSSFQNKTTASLKGNHLLSSSSSSSLEESNSGGSSSASLVLVDRPSLTLTSAERSFKLAQQKREGARVDRKLKMTHRQRMEQLNTHLASLSEHFDIPKVGPG